MIRAIQITGLWCLAVGVGFSDQRAPAKERPPAVRPAPPPVKKNGMPKGPAGPRITNPGNLAARLYLATPEQRDRVIEKLDPQRQQAIRKQLEYFDSLPKDQQQMMITRIERFSAMPPEKKRAFMQQMQALNQLPPDRRGMVGGALRRLQMMNDQQRAAVLNSPEFKGRFSPQEQQIISDLSEVLLPPM